MANIGKRRRLASLFNRKSGRSIIVAMDHGLFLGPIKGVEDIRGAARRVIEGQPDGIQVSRGVASALVEDLMGKDRPAFVLRVDATNIWRSRPEPKEGYRVPVCTVEDAVRMDAEAVVAFFFVGYETDNQEGENLTTLGMLASECEDWGMPLIIEPLVIEKGAHAVRDPERIRLAVRIACEVGADLLKVDYTGDPKSFEEIVQASTVPILIRGGPKMDRDEDVLKMVEESLRAGACGLVFGRNVWQHPDPVAFLSALRAIVHEGASVPHSLEFLAKREPLQR
ncbi:MAG: class I fructose-bisphosphate aldolase [Armatimonadetes bacterium]|nr:class I fructose-bisphosphate aldolase [Armatimonadota bacterium]MDW8121363.1 class I fructose-bisphosphate aldolase [Armatimonadota bacterium]